MRQYPAKEKINLLRNLFKGREDVFARYWEKGNKKGYRPAYQYDPYMYRLHAIKGGTFDEYKDKTLLTLTDNEVFKHLDGEQLIGIYPLLMDNTSWFIAADFDKENWAADYQSFIDACNENKLPAYLERFRSGKGKYIYTSEEALLNDLLQNKNVKHYRHLRYLASKHEGSVCKLRFVLDPFSFVFLLSGAEQYHIILETLDTEEATYVWHIDKNPLSISEELREIDQDLNVIRNKGRQHFLEHQPENFSRIIHDYSDERKGFVLWRDMLEERLV